MNNRIGGERPGFRDGLGALGSVFSKLCEDCKLLSTSDEGEQIAAELARLFQTGVRDETVLTIMLRARLSHRPAKCVHEPEKSSP